jgi:hypothetical protein
MKRESEERDKSRKRGRERNGKRGRKSEIKKS